MLGTSPISSLAISDEITPISLQGNAAAMIKANTAATVSYAATARAKIMVALRGLTGTPLALQALAKMMISARAAPTYSAVLATIAKIMAEARVGFSGSTALAGQSSIQVKASAVFNFPVALAGMIKTMVSARVPLSILQTFSAGIIAVNAGVGNLFTTIFGLGTAYVDTPVMVLQGANLLFSVGADLTRYNYFRLDLTRPDGSAYSVATPDVYMGMVDAFTAIGNFEIGSYVVYRFLPGTLSSGRWAAQLYARDRTDASFYLSPIATFMI